MLCQLAKACFFMMDETSVRGHLGLAMTNL